MKKSIKTSVAALAFAGVFAMLFGALAPVSADVPMPDYNRRIVSFELFEPDADNEFWTSTATVSIAGFNPEFEGADASFHLHFLVDDVVVDVQTFARAIGNVGNCTCGCSPPACCNYEGGWCDGSQWGCWCGITIIGIRTTYTNKSLTPGSVVSIEIVAASDAVEEQYTEDDGASIVVGGSVSATDINWTSVKSLYR